MLTLKFSLISDDSARIKAITGLFDDFERKFNCKIQLQKLSWNEAWPQVLDFALHGTTPDVSHIGSTWTSSLSAMNALRPFSQKEIQRLGGEDAFFHPAWMSTYTGDGNQIWAIPWSTFTYVLVYRRDLIAEAGIDETTAFDTAKDMDNTLHALKTAGVKNPWAIETTSSWDLIHIAASWAWGAGGAYLSSDGKEILLHHPETLAGLRDFFNLYRYLSPQTHYLSSQQCVDLFRQGKCAVTVIAADAIPALLNADQSIPEVQANLGTAALPGKPWVGGDNLVVWKNSLASQALRKANLDFVSYLTDKKTQIDLYNTARILPARTDALAEIAFNPPMLSATLKRVFDRGQAHPSFRLWGRVENELRKTFGIIVTELLNDPKADVDSGFKRYLIPLAHRLEFMVM